MGAERRRWWRRVWDVIDGLDTLASLGRIVTLPFRLLARLLDF